MVRSLAGRQRGEATALPGWIKPQLTKLVDQPPDGPEWLHELKFDGYRMHARLDRGAVRLLTRTGLDWTHKYPPIAAAVALLPARQASLDGELCGVGVDGTISFSLIQNASDTPFTRSTSPRTRLQPPGARRRRGNGGGRVTPQSLEYFPPLAPGKAAKLLASGGEPTWALSPGVVGGDLRR
jgi:hypothetical protein